MGEHSGKLLFGAFALLRSFFIGLLFTLGMGMQMFALTNDQNHIGSVGTG